ncbi:AI-2E family transporter [Geodermatophilus obscurus]|uniref:AI-2E family transporter n=1 Tax=Geodermatophilus obscurus TaxID=1861 RepID=UPI00140F5F77
MQQAEGNPQEPLILSPVLQLHPFAVILAVTAGAVISGALGAFLAVPMAAIPARVVDYLRGRRPAAAPARSRTTTHQHGGMRPIRRRRTPRSSRTAVLADARPHSRSARPGDPVGAGRASRGPDGGRSARPVRTGHPPPPCTGHDAVAPTGDCRVRRSSPHGTA